MVRRGLNADDDEILFRCCGSACMMWRWELTEHGIRELQAGTLDTSKPHNGGMLHGYCGLAGK